MERINELEELNREKDNTILQLKEEIRKNMEKDNIILQLKEEIKELKNPAASLSLPISSHLIPSTSQQEHQDKHVQIFAPLVSELPPLTSQQNNCPEDDDKDVQIFCFKTRDEELCSDYLQYEAILCLAKKDGLSKKGLVAGEGHFGCVYEAKWQDQCVPVKELLGLP